MALILLVIVPDLAKKITEVFTGTKIPDVPKKILYVKLDPDPHQVWAVHLDNDPRKHIERGKVYFDFDPSRNFTKQWNNCCVLLTVDENDDADAVWAWFIRQGTIIPGDAPNLYEAIKNRLNISVCPPVTGGERECNMVSVVNYNFSSDTKDYCGKEKDRCPEGGCCWLLQTRGKNYIYRFKYGLICAPDSKTGEILWHPCTGSVVDTSIQVGEDNYVCKESLGIFFWEKMAFDFEILLDKYEETVKKGESVIVSLNVTRRYSQGTVNFGCENLPQNVSCSFNPSSCTLSSQQQICQSNLNISVGDQAPLGTHTISIKANEKLILFTLTLEN